MGPEIIVQGDKLMLLAGRYKKLCRLRIADGLIHKQSIPSYYLFIVELFDDQ